MEKVVKIGLEEVMELNLPLTPDDVKMTKEEKNKFKSLKKVLAVSGGSLTVETAFPLYTKKYKIPDVVPVTIRKTTFKITKKGNVKMVAEVKGEKLKMAVKISAAIYAHIMQWTEHFRTIEFADDFNILSIKNPEDFWASFPKESIDLPKELNALTKELASNQFKIGKSLKLAFEMMDQIVISTMIMVDFKVDKNYIVVFCPTEGRIISMTTEEFLHAKALHTHCVVKNVIEPDNTQEKMVKTIFDKIIPNIKEDLGEKPDFNSKEKEEDISVFVKDVMGLIIPEIKSMLSAGKSTFKITKKGKIKDTDLKIDTELLAKICSAVQTTYKFSDDFVGMLAKKHKTDEGPEIFLCAKILSVDVDRSTSKLVGTIETSERGVETFNLRPEEFALDVIRFVEMELLAEGPDVNPEFIVSKKKSGSRSKSKSKKPESEVLSDEMSEIVEDIFDGLKDIFKD